MLWLIILNVFLYHTYELNSEGLLLDRITYFGTPFSIVFSTSVVQSILFAVYILLYILFFVILYRGCRLLAKNHYTRRYKIFLGFSLSIFVLVVYALLSDGGIVPVLPYKLFNNANWAILAIILRVLFINPVPELYPLCKTERHIDKKTGEEIKREKECRPKFYTPNEVVGEIYENISKRVDLLEVFECLLRFDRGINIWLSFYGQPSDPVELKFGHKFTEMHGESGHSIQLENDYGSALLLHLDEFAEYDYDVDLYNHVFVLFLTDRNRVDMEFQFVFDHGVYERCNEDYEQCLEKFRTVYRENYMSIPKEDEEVRL